MPQVNVVRAFDLLREDGSEQRFFPGVQEMSEEDANHWHTRGNLDTAGSIPPRIGSYEFHTLHPAIQTLDALQASHATAEAAALAEEDEKIANMRSQRAAERREKYNEEINTVRQGKTIEGVDTGFADAFTSMKRDPNAPRTAYPMPGSLPNMPIRKQTDNTTEEANSGDGPGETDATKTAKRERIKVTKTQVDETADA